MENNNKRVIIIVSCPSIVTLRRLVENYEEYRDIPRDRSVERKITDTMEELLFTYLDTGNSFDSVCDIVLDEIVTFISNYVHIYTIHNVICWYDDTILIRCMPGGVKNGCSIQSERFNIR